MIRAPARPKAEAHKPVINGARDCLPEYKRVPKKAERAARGKRTSTLGVARCGGTQRFLAQNRILPCASPATSLPPASTPTRASPSSSESRASSILTARPSSRRPTLVMPASWSQVRRRHHGAEVLPQSRRARRAATRARGWCARSGSGVPRARPTSEDSGGEHDARQIFGRLAGTWTYWGWKHGYFDAEADRARLPRRTLLHDGDPARGAELAAVVSTPACTGAYGITGPAQGHWYVDPEGGEPERSTSAYERPQPHACFIQSVADDLVNEGGIMDLWTRRGAHLQVRLRHRLQLLQDPRRGRGGSPAEASPPG